MASASRSPPTLPKFQPHRVGYTLTHLGSGAWGCRTGGAPLRPTSSNQISCRVRGSILRGPALLHVNHESRGVALKHVKFRTTRDGNGNVVFQTPVRPFLPTVDVVYLSIMDMRSLRFETEPWKGNTARNIYHLAIPQFLLLRSQTPREHGSRHDCRPSKPYHSSPSSWPAAYAGAAGTSALFAPYNTVGTGKQQV